MRFTSLLLIFITTCQISLAQSGKKIFDTSILHEIRINFSTPNFYDSLNHYYVENYNSDIPYMMADISIDGDKVDSVGIRFKGFTSYDSPSKKKPLKIDFNEFVKGKKYEKLRKLNLNTGFGDPAMQRDAYSYFLFRELGVPAPRTSFTKVYLNDQYWGVYVMVEQVDKRFLKDNYDSSKGNLFKNKGWSNLEWKGSDAEEYKKNFELKTNKEEADWTRFVKLIHTIDNSSDQEFRDSISSIFNVEQFLKVLAVDVFTGNWDSYLDNARNWYMYQDHKTGIFHWIPWDYNLALGGKLLEENSTTTDIKNFSIQNPADEKVLIKRLLNIPEYRKQYYQYFCQLLNHIITPEKVENYIKANRSLIEEAYKTEPHQIYTFDDFSKDISSDEGSLTHKIIAQLQAKKAELAGLYNCNATAAIEYQAITINEVVASNDSTSLNTDSAGEYDDWIELYNNSNSAIDLSNTFLSDDKDKLNKWQFPANTIIAPDAYLIVWADKDTGQEGLHANFKLKKSGESLYLSNVDLTAIDSMSYSELKTNEAYARVPNGTGDFEKQASTFGKNNEITSSSEEIKLSKAKVYPNPTRDRITIEMTERRPYYIQLFSTYGRQLQVWDNDEAAESLTIDISRLPEGSYFLHITDKESRQVQTHKIIKIN